jgi:hypothetical protein
MAIGNQDFTMFAGETKNLVVKISDSNGSVMDLAGLISAKWVVKSSMKTTATTLISKDTSNNGVTVTNTSQGELEIRIDSGDTSNLHGTFYHVAEIVDSLNNHSTIMFGKVSIT